MFCEELTKRNRYPYPEQQCVATWKDLPIDKTITGKIDFFTDFQEKHSYMEVIVQACVEVSTCSFLLLLLLLLLYCNFVYFYWDNYYSQIHPALHQIPAHSTLELCL